MWVIDDLEVQGVALAEELTPGQAHWHTHRFHQILYASAGSLRLEVAPKEREAGQWLLPPARAAWIPAHMRHRAVVHRPVSLRTVYVTQALVPTAVRDCKVFSVSSLLREMILYAMRWDPTRDVDNPSADRFFAALADVCLEQFADELPLKLPLPGNEMLRSALTFMLENLQNATMDTAAQAASVSPRTLARGFEREGTSWGQILKTARMMRATELLDDTDRTVGDIAWEVGFESQSAFTHAFRQALGEPPAKYRRRRM